MTDVQRRIAALSPEQRARLEQKLEQKLADRAGAAPARDRIAPRDRRRPAPLAFAQQREWAISRLNQVNNITGAVRLEGDLDLDLLGRVLTAVVERHEALRTTVEVHGQTPVQLVHPVTPVPTPIVDLTHLPPEQHAAEIATRYRAEAALPFDPAEPRRLRFTLLRFAPTVHIALFTMDHAASDAWSLAILVQEIGALYQVHRRGGTLPPLEIQFADYATWQQAHFDEARLAGELSHWRAALDGLPARPELPTDRPFPARPTFAGDRYSRDVPAALTSALRQFGEREGASLFTVLLATASVLLARHLQVDDLVIGSAISGRNRVETENLIGCFSNLLPLRVRLRDEQTLRDAVQHARDVMATAYDHQDLPFTRLIEELGVPRETPQTPLIQMMINVLTAPDTTLEVPGLRISPEPMDLGRASIELALSAVPRADGLELQWHYMTELFDAATVELLAAQFETVLWQVVTAPDTLVGQVRIDATVDSVPVRPTGSDGTTFVDWFRRRVALAPNAAAVIHDGSTTTYGELNRAADRLARHLRGAGVRRETPVAILLEPSADLAAAILAVLFAGGVYVPLDPAYPRDRLSFMLADARAQVLLTNRRLADLADADAAYRTVAIDDPDLPDGADITGGPDPASLAYVVYTSGSTGRPKGAMIEHRSLLVFAREVAERFGLGAGDRFLQFASPSFDVLVEELFPTWYAGGAVVIPPRRLLGGGIDLADLCERDRLTVMELPTAYWHEWVRELERQQRRLPPSLRLVIIGGERVLADRIARWRRLDVPLLHVYGLTETTCSSTFFRLDPVDQDREWPNLPIGTPLPSADLRILDQRLRPVPVGGAGELYIGGISLARGYLHRPGPTAERFVADPDPAHPGQRLYRTGDLVRQRADGQLEFLSRVDTQIKIRGFRVEPAEIEAVLSRHPGVAESIVVVHEPEPGNRRLVAYVAPPAGTAAPGVRELRTYLEQQLPPYLVPSAFVELDALPLNANGKVDRERLPVPDSQRPELTEEYAAPRSPVEVALATIVASVVGVDRVGLYDNFFEIGGDSILAIQVVAKARAEGVRLDPLDLFTHPTVAMLAEIAGRETGTEAGEPEPADGPVPLAPNQRAWFTNAHTESVISTVVDLPRPVDADHVRTAVDALIARHDALRQRFLPDGAQTRVRIAPPELASEQGTEQRTEQDLDIAAGPLLRVTTAGPQRLALAVHRLAADPASMRILADELATALTRLAAGDPISLPPATTSWRTWARRLATLAEHPDVQAERAYWSSVVSPPAATPPVDDRDDTAVVSTDAGPVTEELLLTALSRTLSGWTGQDRHLVDVERHDRESDLSRTVGWLSTVHPLALTGPALRTVRDALRAVPSGGRGWALLQHGPDPLTGEPVTVGFSYLGDGDGDVQMPDGPHPVEVRCSAVGGTLTIRWRGGGGGRTAHDLADAFRAELHGLAADGDGSAAPSPADFPLARIDQGQLDTLLSRLAGGSEPK